jgi:hypothetical protein
MLISIKLVFSHWTYIAIAGTIATTFWIVFNVFEQLLFFSPIVVFYLPEDAITGFIFSTITAIHLNVGDISLAINFTNFSLTGLEFVNTISVNPKST